MHRILLYKKESVIGEVIMEKHELVDINGNKTGEILTHVEARDINNVPNGRYISVVGVVIINENDEILLQKRSRFKRVYYVRKNVDLKECKLQEEELEEVKYFRIEELQKLDNEGFEWLDNLKKII